MPSYLFEFTANIDERKRPENFPNEIYVREQYPEIENDHQLQELFNSRFVTMIKNPGLVVFPDESEIIQTSLTFDRRIFVPWHMITHFRGRVKLITPHPSESLIPAEPVLDPVDAKRVLN